MIPTAAVNARIGHTRVAAGEMSKAAATDAVLLRRLDWRFLLDAHELRCIGYLGPARGVLPSALLTFSQTYQALDSGRAPQRLVDVIVAKDVDCDSIVGALPALKPGGWLYWELRSGRDPFTEDWAALGATDVGPLEFYWHYPSFDECRLIVPLSRPTALASLICQRVNRVHRSAVQMTVRAVIRTGILTRVLPSVSIVAKKRVCEALR